ncbi:hypothetical protein [Alkalicoccus chagannorensis]|uniref:hypothetical protein n=1 Tax=Alkalicoccus chagannorensis TaxID=427072 RepID=UPI00047D685C|nr:hypothetical protein [Alkalicoccus chagannorensis]
MKALLLVLLLGLSGCAVDWTDWSGTDAEPTAAEIPPAMVDNAEEDIVEDGDYTMTIRAENNRDFEATLTYRGSDPVEVTYTSLVRFRIADENLNSYTPTGVRVGRSNEGMIRPQFPEVWHYSFDSFLEMGPDPGTYTVIAIASFEEEESGEEREFSVKTEFDYEPEYED